GADWKAALAAEASLAVMAFGAPTVVMGALFTHLCVEARRGGVGFGRALGVNTLAAAVAPPLCGVVLVPALGLERALLLVVAGYLGLGTGVTASSAAEDTTLAVDAVELLPEVVAASASFAAASGEGSAARLHVVVADARRFVRAGDRPYDVIVSDNFHPSRSGSGALYTVEHFE